MPPICYVFVSPSLIKHKNIYTNTGICITIAQRGHIFYDKMYINSNTVCLGN
jgi:hypothetical protein